MSKYNYIAAKTIIAENKKRTQDNKFLIRHLGKAFANKDWNDKFVHHAYKLWGNLLSDTHSYLPKKTRAMHMVCAFHKGQKFTQVEQCYYHPEPWEMMIKENDRYSLLNERRLRQISAIDTALKFIDRDERSNFNRWIKNTGMNDEHSNTS